MFLGSLNHFETAPMTHHLRSQLTSLPAMLILLTTASGCAGIGTSRWAMDDPVYAEKYDTPYPDDEVEKVARMMKQASDARYVDERGGWYMGGAAAGDPFGLGAEIGMFSYLNHSTEGRIGLKGILGTGAETGFGGVDFGIRTQSPSRLAPFVGVGTYLGISSEDVPAANDGIDNDNDHSIDEYNEVEEEHDFLASFYPELGAHFWMNSRTRLTTNAQYHITTEGRDSDFWFVGFSIAFLLGGDEE